MSWVGMGCDGAAELWNEGRYVHFAAPRTLIWTWFTSPNLFNPGEILQNSLQLLHYLPVPCSHCCLRLRRQEIDWKWYDSFWRDSMSGRGYDSVVGVTKLRNEHNVGQAIFWKKVSTQGRGMLDNAPRRVSKQTKRAVEQQLMPPAFANLNVAKLSVFGTTTSKGSIAMAGMDTTRQVRTGVWAVSCAVSLTGSRSVDAGQVPEELQRLVPLPRPAARTRRGEEGCLRVLHVRMRERAR